MTRVVVSGSRDLGYEEVCEAMESCPFEPTYIMQGEARGVDAAAARWAEERGIEVLSYPITSEDVERAGRARCGQRRNRRMIDDGAEAIVIVWDGSSGGTKHAEWYAKEQGLPVHKRTFASRRSTNASSRDDKKV